MSSLRRWLSMASIGSAALIGCEKDKPPAPPLPPAPLVPSSSARVSSAASAADVPHHAGASDSGGGPVRRAFRGKDFILAIESHGNKVRAMFERAGTFELRGTMKDATHFSARDVHAPNGGKAMTIVGEWSPDGSTLTAKLTGPADEKGKDLQASLGPFEASVATFTTDFKGWLGRGFVRMKLTRDGAKLTGIYRYAKSAEDIDLAGTVSESDGTFELTESVHGKVTGRFVGIFASLYGALATWSSADGSRSIPMALEPGAGIYPETVAVGGGLSLYPQESVHESDACSTDIVFPQVRGAKDRAKETALNLSLRGDWEKIFACDTPLPEALSSSFQDASYTFLTKKKGRFVSLAQSQFYYSAGAAHPQGNSACTVIDTQTVTEVSLNDQLTAAGRTELGVKVTRALQGDGPKLSEQYFNSDDLVIDPRTNVCLTDTAIEVAFERYEVAPYVMGLPEVSFPKADVRSLFEKSDVMDALFAQ